MFIQKDNVRNQRENVVLAIANAQSRLGLPIEAEPVSTNLAIWIFYAIAHLTICCSILFAWTSLTMVYSVVVVKFCNICFSWLLHLSEIARCTSFMSCLHLSSLNCQWPFYKIFFATAFACFFWPSIVPEISPLVGCILFDLVQLGTIIHDVSLISSVLQSHCSYCIHSSQINFVILVDLVFIRHLCSVHHDVVKFKY